jgi:predicted amidohydrolase
VTRLVQIAAVQAGPRPIGGDLDGFAEEVLRDVQDASLLIYPELHLFGTETIASSDADHVELLKDAARSLDSELVRGLGDVARAAGIWLLPGSICERGPAGELFNTAVVFAPDGTLRARYRKVFPWRPYEPYTPGAEFVTVDLDGVGRFGLSICYDAWFPEVTRHLAWMGAEVVLNVVKTTTPDRAQEVLLARANSIVNQTFTVSVNCAGPIGEGRSLIVDPEGLVRVAVEHDERAVLRDLLDLDQITRVRERGTAGVNRMWTQFRDTDPPLELPLYDGRIDPNRWNPEGERAAR